MAASGGQPGNRNAAKAKWWEEAVRHEVARDRTRLNRIAAKVLEAAEAGEAWAVTEVRNTLDGKPKEHVLVETTEPRLSYAERLAQGIADSARRATGESALDTVQ